MKKLVLTIAIVLGVTFGATAQQSSQFFDKGQQQPANNGGFFGGSRGDGSKIPGTPGTPGLPGHGETGDSDAPLGSGAMLLIGLGAAYAVRKRKNK
ncbi:MAG: LPXTG cell wall anchor domain-containing protein [Bacteroidales bacterium]|nr:LPXTG cell wall anchor domain-containing protein [Bacteroidales bacterium]